MEINQLKGWKYIVYIIIKNNFGTQKFKLKDIYDFESYFAKVYPNNKHIKDKIRQSLQYLRNEGVISFLEKGVYQLAMSQTKSKNSKTDSKEFVYLLSNESIPNWIKIGKSKCITRRLKELYNTSVPLPFKLEDSIEVECEQSSFELEKSIHSIIDTINPKVRKNTKANRREFFKLSVNQGKEIFKLVTQISKIQTR